MKFSANIPDELLVFLDAQVKEGRYKSRSQALTEALQSWRTQKFADYYAKAFAEYDDSWDDALADGLTEDDTRCALRVGRLCGLTRALVTVASNANADQRSSSPMTRQIEPPKLWGEV